MNLRTTSAFKAAYLGEKFHLDRRGFGYAPEELALALHEVAADLASEEGLDR